ncbi:hypothetical protein PMIN01_06251 [Paraphaeosphaeria minitans]|uniref:Uncharacterized protein n=1 Tax=Paraphaeosphaeria minitans TaxID=565426 RepID=A0A9P6GJX2_9PLEO|nr:hypothetical protein PMIN01_06251 [Paraphaeosphaeria minitans]
MKRAEADSGPDAGKPESEWAEDERREQRSKSEGVRAGTETQQAVTEHGMEGVPSGRSALSWGAGADASLRAGYQEIQSLGGVGACSVGWCWVVLGGAPGARKQQQHHAKAEMAASPLDVDHGLAGGHAAKGDVAAAGSADVLRWIFNGSCGGSSMAAVAGHKVGMAGSDAGASAMESVCAGWYLGGRQWAVGRAGGVSGAHSELNSRHSSRSGTADVGRANISRDRTDATWTWTRRTRTWTWARKGAVGTSQQAPSNGGGRWQACLACNGPGRVYNKAGTHRQRGGGRWLLVAGRWLLELQRSPSASCKDLLEAESDPQGHDGGRWMQLGR